ncbi:MAG: hypothetical protein ABIH25_00060 [Candidatus Woesearchaeota archaeon]
MLDWLFKKREDKDFTKKFNEVESTLKTSFSNIKEDMKILFEHTEKAHSKHSKHEENFQKIHQRLLALEALIYKDKDIEEVVNEIEEIETEERDHLTEISQKICMVLAALGKENPEKLIPLKILAEEMYPDKKYQGIRSTISQYTTELEKLGYIQKKRRGRQVYIKSTEKNPYLKKQTKQKKKIKVKN